MAFTLLDQFKQDDNGAGVLSSASVQNGYIAIVISVRGNISNPAISGFTLVVDADAAATGATESILVFQREVTDAAAESDYAFSVNVSLSFHGYVASLIQLSGSYIDSAIADDGMSGGVVTPQVATVPAGCEAILCHSCYSPMSSPPATSSDTVVASGNTDIGGSATANSSFSIVSKSFADAGDTDFSPVTLTGSTGPNAASVLAWFNSGDVAPSVNPIIRETVNDGSTGSNVPISEGVTLNVGVLDTLGNSVVLLSPVVVDSNNQITIDSDALQIATDYIVYFESNGTDVSAAKFGVSTIDGNA